MNQLVALQKEVRSSPRVHDGLAIGLAFLAYMAVFLFMGDSLVRAARSSLVNLVPLILVSIAARAVIGRYLLTAPLPRQMAGHIILAGLFSITWFWGLMVAIGVGVSDSPLEFAVRRFFDHPAIAWQLLQGITVYALVACLTYLQARPPLPDFVIGPPGEESLTKDPALSRYFIRQGDEIRPIDVTQIVSITGADDYAEVSTSTGRHLVRMTLAEFEQSLEGGRFIRVHRSRIVNMDRIDRAEPAGGGRMLLHMDNGEMIQASRAGSKLLRDRVI